MEDDITVISECLQSFISVPDAMALQRSVLLVAKRKTSKLQPPAPNRHIIGIVHHIHIHSQAPNISILEVGFYEDFHFSVHLRLSTIWTIRSKYMMKENKDGGEELEEPPIAVWL